MSSVQEKSIKVTKGFLLRSSSLQKIKCSAAPVLGSIFSKDSSLIHLVVNAINSSRNALEKPTVVLVLPAVQFLCVAMAFGGQLIRAIGEGVSFESIQKVIERINQFKSKQQSYSVRRHVQAKNKQETQEQIVSKEEDVRTTRGDCLDGETFYDCRETFGDCSRKSSDNFALKIASLGCVFLVYLQFSFLVCMVGYTQMKAGFLFLLVCTFCISSLVLKISFMTNSSSQKQKRLSRKQQQTKGEETKAMNSARLIFGRLQSGSCLRKAKLL